MCTTHPEVFSFINDEQVISMLHFTKHHLLETEHIIQSLLSCSVNGIILQPVQYFEKSFIKEMLANAKYIDIST
jgi:hypothetical protein